jgi:hypothetical protein
MQQFRRKHFRRASRARRERSIRPKISRIDFELAELPCCKVWSGRPKPAVDFHTGAYQLKRAYLTRRNKNRLESLGLGGAGNTLEVANVVRAPRAQRPPPPPPSRRSERLRGGGPSRNASVSLDDDSEAEDDARSDGSSSSLVRRAALLRSTPRSAALFASKTFVAGYAGILDYLDLRTMLACAATCRCMRDAVDNAPEDKPGSESAWKSTAGSGRPGQTSELSSSAKSKSFWLIFGRIDRSRRALEAQHENSRQNIRIRAH